jgi:hypothetical protein
MDTQTPYQAGDGYTQVPGAEDFALNIEGGAKQEIQATKSPIKFAPLLIGIAVSLLLYFAALATFQSSSAANMLKDSQSCGACSFAQCKRTMCDPTTVPFVCIAGAAHDGCAATDAAWIGNSVCDECCDSSACASAAPSEDDDSIALCGACSAEDCSALSSKCNVNDPYLCLSGGARYGCSDDKYHWPTALNGICLQCCDLSTC